MSVCTVKPLMILFLEKRSGFSGREGTASGGFVVIVDPEA